MHDMAVCGKNGEHKRVYAQEETQEKSLVREYHLIAPSHALAHSLENNLGRHLFQFSRNTELEKGMSNQDYDTYLLLLTLDSGTRRFEVLYVEHQDKSLARRIFNPRINMRAVAQGTLSEFLQMERYLREHKFDIFAAKKAELATLTFKTGNFSYSCPCQAYLDQIYSFLETRKGVQSTLKTTYKTVGISESYYGLGMVSGPTTEVLKVYNHLIGNGYGISIHTPILSFYADEETQSEYKEKKT